VKKGGRGVKSLLDSGGGELPILKDIAEADYTVAA